MPSKRMGGPKPPTNAPRSGTRPAATDRAVAEPPGARGAKPQQRETDGTGAAGLEKRAVAAQKVTAQTRRHVLKGAKAAEPDRLMAGARSLDTNSEPVGPDIASASASLALAMPEALGRGGRPADAPGTPNARWYEELGVLNRHWYRRCLDSLSKTLHAVGSDPGIEAIQKLGDQIITAFLSAVTGQAPDSSQPQFPADRAFFIPFEGDNAAKFNFAKPYYQLLDQPGGVPTHLEGSIWSFLPWVKGEGTSTGIELAGGRGGACLVSSNASVNEQQQTIPFAEMVSVHELFKHYDPSKPVDGRSDGAAAAVARQDRDVVWLKKSLLLRDEEGHLIRELFSAPSSAPPQSPATRKSATGTTASASARNSERRSGRHWSRSSRSIALPLETLQSSSSCRITST